MSSPLSFSQYIHARLFSCLLNRFSLYFSFFHLIFLPWSSFSFTDVEQYHPFVSLHILFSFLLSFILFRVLFSLTSQYHTHIHFPVHNFAIFCLSFQYFPFDFFLNASCLSLSLAPFYCFPLLHYFPFLNRQYHLFLYTPPCSYCPLQVFFLCIFLSLSQRVAFFPSPVLFLPLSVSLFSLRSLPLTEQHPSYSISLFPLSLSPSLSLPLSLSQRDRFSFPLSVYDLLPLLFTIRSIKKADYKRRKQSYKFYFLIVVSTSSIIVCSVIHDTRSLSVHVRPIILPHPYSAYVLHPILFSSPTLFCFHILILLFSCHHCPILRFHTLFFSYSSFYSVLFSFSYSSPLFRLHPRFLTLPLPFSSPYPILFSFSFIYSSPYSVHFSSSHFLTYSVPHFPC